MHITTKVPKVRKGTFRSMKNENKRHKRFNMVLHMHWGYVSVCGGNKKDIKKQTNKKGEKPIQ